MTVNWDRTYWSANTRKMGKPDSLVLGGTHESGCVSFLLIYIRRLMVAPGRLNFSPPPLITDYLYDAPGHRMMSSETQGGKEEGAA